ncbi:nucleotidyltransferase family protein [Anaeromyxobacter oryzisoli]|uniref:nucleotidyltransferase n=1 Tax=Anaeromyxobacter oryzisoli TaxID=2925408 RepID=UPI001F5A4E19|nr:nucleotidyltransferase [Anaeromyxobacter sp. SG63]
MGVGEHAGEGGSPVARPEGGARLQAELDARAAALRALAASGVPFMVAGAYALFEYTGIFRDTKDLDLFLRERDLEDAFRVLEAAGFRTELTDPGWIGKAWKGPWYVDLIFSSGNGLAVVDDVWFEHARTGRVLDVEALLAPPEEMIWSKSFVLERERYDGADVNHLLRACGETLDWERLLARFDQYWEVLFSHLLLFEFAFPAARSVVPDWIMRELLRRTTENLRAGDHPVPLCRGNLMSRVQYRHDLEQLGLGDGRRWDEADQVPERAVGDGGERDVPPGGGG